jgi:hypothetical protein
MGTHNLRSLQNILKLQKQLKNPLQKWVGVLRKSDIEVPGQEVVLIIFKTGVRSCQEIVKKSKLGVQGKGSVPRKSETGVGNCQKLIKKSGIEVPK